MKLSKTFKSTALVATISILSIATLSWCNKENPDKVTFDQAYQTFVNQTFDSENLQKLVKMSFQDYYKTDSNISLELTHPDLKANADLEINGNFWAPTNEEIIKNTDYLKKVIYDIKSKVKLAIESKSKNLPMSWSASLEWNIDFIFSDLVADIKLSNAKLDLKPNWENPQLEASKQMIDNQIKMFSDKRYTIDLKKIIPVEQMKNNLHSSFIKKSIMISLPSMIKEELLKNKLLTQNGDKTTYENMPAYSINMDYKVLKTILTNLSDKIFVWNDDNTKENKENFLQAIKNIDQISKKDTDWIKAYFVIKSEDNIMLVVEWESLQDNTNIKMTLKCEKEKWIFDLKIDNIENKDFSILANANIDWKNLTANIDVENQGKKLWNAKLDYEIISLSDKLIKSDAELQINVTKDGLAFISPSETEQKDMSIKLKVNGTQESIEKFKPETHDDAIDIINMLGAMGWNLQNSWNINSDINFENMQNNNQLSWN